jgi:hypothetical protein
MWLTKHTGLYSAILPSMLTGKRAPWPQLYAAHVILALKQYLSIGYNLIIRNLYKKWAFLTFGTPSL